MKLNKLDLNLLIVFDTVFRTRNITRAGAELHLTQSAVSNALNRLRRLVADQLFIRSARGMIPTQVAQRLARPVREILSQVQYAFDQTWRFDPRVAKQHFRLFLSDVAQLVFLPKLVARIAAEAPGVSLETVATSPTEGRMLMESGDIDLAIGYFEGFGRTILRERLFMERYVCVVRRNHPLIGKRLTLQQFLTCPHAVYRPTAGSHAFFEDSLDQFFIKIGQARFVALRVSHGLGLGEIIRQTDLLASLPSRLAAEFVRTEKLRALKLPIYSPAFEISQFWHQRVQTDGANIWLRGLVSKLFASTRDHGKLHAAV
jgi:DNA-binding transcriptional LysR family regulator